MCWCGDVNDKKIAQKDIKTKKIVDLFQGHYYGYYQEWFEYELGKEYTTKVTPRNHSFDEDIRIIDIGFHSYAWDIEMKSLCGGGIQVNSNRLNGGQTTFINLNNLNRGYHVGNHKIVVVECTIPKGTAYWENRVGEIVSEKLIVEEEIRIKDDCNFC